jgi:hypothetical protein
MGHLILSVDVTFYYTLPAIREKDQMTHKYVNTAQENIELLVHSATQWAEITPLCFI